MLKNAVKDCLIFQPRVRAGRQVRTIGPRIEQKKIRGNDVMTILLQMARRAATISNEALPDDVSHAARRCVVDWFSAAIPGSVEAPATLLRKSMADELGHGRARLLPDGLGGFH